MKAAHFTSESAYLGCTVYIGSSLKLKSHIDMFPQLLQCDGNLYDAISVAIKAALFNTK